MSIYPRFWMHDPSSELHDAVKAYLNNKTLTGRQLQLMKQYLRQWVNASAWRDCTQLETLRKRVAAIKTRDDVSRAIEEAIELMMDPL